MGSFSEKQEFVDSAKKLVQLGYALFGTPGMHLNREKKPDMHIYPFNRNLLIISTHWHTKHNMIESVVKKTCYEELSAAGLNSLWHSWYA